MLLKMMLLKKTVYNNLVAKVNNIDTKKSVLKTKYQTEKAKLEKKIPDVTDLVRETKLIELKNVIPDVNDSATKTALSAEKNKMPDVSRLVALELVLILFNTNT